METPSRRILRAPRQRKVLLAMGWYAGQIQSGVAQFAREANWILNVDMMRSASLPPAWKGDGIIAVLGSNDAMDRDVLRMKLPLVNIGPAGGPNVPSVMPDNQALAKLAVEHYVSRGFRHFAFYSRTGGPGETMRYNAFCAALAQQRLSPHLLRCLLTQQRPRGGASRQTWLCRMIQSLPKPLAIFTEFDDPAVEILQVCEAGGIAVPEQVAVLGVDNDELQCDFAPVPLSSIDDDQRGQGYAAASMLSQWMSGKAPKASSVLIPPLGIITRRSSDILAVEHPYVATALREIWQNYTQPLTASDIAASVPMSARRLHDAFVHHVGHSIADELARKRVEHAQGLIKSSKLKLRQIAEQSGFSSPDHLAKVFTRVTGLTPSAYRKARSVEE